MNLPQLINIRVIRQQRLFFHFNSQVLPRKRRSSAVTTQFIRISIVITVKYWRIVKPIKYQMVYVWVHKTQFQRKSKAVRISLSQNLNNNMHTNFYMLANPVPIIAFDRNPSFMHPSNVDKCPLIQVQRSNLTITDLSRIIEW
uniref:Uncharacterized protein n=1 Tax=Opuntia streptacantha TaxID=393608 RepID=A0A7C9EWY6_OPUST